MKKKILIEGNCGYIGSILTQYLLRAGYQVIGVDNLMYQNGAALMGYLGHPEYEFHLFDVLNENRKLSELIQRADAIIPLAALVGAPACKRRPEYAQQLNADHIKWLVSQMSEGQRLVIPDSNSAYGRSPPGEECTEASPLNPLSVYARTKLEGEQWALTHKNTVVFRLATVFGPSPRMRFDLLVNDLTERAYRANQSTYGRNICLYEWEARRNFVHVRDVARAFVYALENRKLEGIYNCGDSQANMTKRQLANTILEELGAEISVVQSGEKDVDGRDYQVSNKKLLSAGFEFQHGLRSGIREIAQLCSIFPAQITKTWRNA